MIFTEYTENNEIIFNESIYENDDRESKPSNKEQREYHKRITQDTKKAKEAEYFKKHNITDDKSLYNGKTGKRYAYNDDLYESVTLTFSGNNGGSYMHDALYESYLQVKIDSEDRLAFALKENMVISEADYSNIRVLQEAKLSDKIKVTWKKFVAFIKGMVARFMESMTNILFDEKDYLEKYKDIILNRRPKEDMEYSYTGNYTKGINRLINTTVPIFDYYKYKKTA